MAEFGCKNPLYSTISYPDPEVERNPNRRREARLLALEQAYNENKKQEKEA